MSEVVLDASALLALLLQEPGAEIVSDALPGSIISAVNFSEVGSRLRDRGIAGDQFQRTVVRFRIGIVPFDRAMADLAIDLRDPTRHLGLSLGDRACLALASYVGCQALTADRRWARLDVGVDIRVIRNEGR